MSIVQSASGLYNINVATNHLLGSPAVNLNGTLASYSYLYAEQPAVRTCVDYLARTISRVPLYAYEQISPTEKRRITDGEIAKVINRPWVGATRSAFYADLVRDLMLYDMFIGVKIKTDDGTLGVLRVPMEYIELKAKSFMAPEKIIVRGLGGTQEYDLEQVIFIKGYNPIYGQNYRGLSPMETLRRLLAELESAARYREGYWKNAARISGVIQRPVGAPKWSPEARSRFRNDWQSAYAGDGSSGRTAVLEDGMEWKAAAFSASDSQYIESMTLTRSQVASAYGIDPSLLGIGKAGGAHLDVSHRLLLVETIQPHLIRIQEELELQLLPELTNNPNITLQFDIESLTRGTLEETATIYQAIVGAPWLTRNEARMRVGLGPIDGGDELVTPLNVITGGMASPQDTVSTDRQLATLSTLPKSLEPNTKAVGKLSPYVKKFLRTRTKYEKELTTILDGHIARQKSSVLSKYGASKSVDPETKANTNDLFNKKRFRAEMKADIKKLLTTSSQEFGNNVSSKAGLDFNAEEGMDNYLDLLSENSADALSDYADSGIDMALASDDPEADLDTLFDSGLTALAIGIGMSLLTSSGNTAAMDAAEFAGVGEKTWVVTAENPRESHAEIDGETVPMGELFSNGLRWPGDSENGDAEDRANCTCLVDFVEPTENEDNTGA